jgi:hypothetical protein
MTVEAITAGTDIALVLEIIQAAGPRGASHEDFIEAGLARDYIASLRHLADVEGVQIRTDFTTGQARWALVAETARDQRTA